MSSAEIDRAWALMESIMFCMLSTWDGQQIRSRPMAAVVRRTDGCIYFLADVRAHKDDQIEQDPKVYLTFAHPHRQKYVSVVGRAEVSSDRGRIRKLWSIAAKMWWASPDDPNIRVITVTPIEADYWDSPNTWISNLRVAFGLLLGKHPDPGDRIHVVFHQS